MFVISTASFIQEFRRGPQVLYNLNKFHARIHFPISLKTHNTAQQFRTEHEEKYLMQEN